jgi:hypothetical protein
MAQRLEAPNRYAAPSLWMLALTTVVLATGSLAILVWKPKAFWLALLVGLVAFATRGIFVQVREATHRRAEASNAVSNAGLALAAVAVAPLLAFAFLWAGLLLILGLTWVLSELGIV